MTGLEDAFGEDFVEEYEKTIAEKRAERRQVSEDTMKEIAHKAINQDKFKEGEPQFQHVTESDVTHDVLLMQLPSIEGSSVFQYADELDTGAVTCPLDYMGEWMNCLFNDADDLKEMEEGEHYIVIGELSTWTPDDGQGEPQDQMSPVRGVLTLDEAKEYAEQSIGAEVNETPVEESTEEDDEEDDSSEDDTSFLGDDDEGEDEDDETAVEYDDVAGVVEALAEQEEEVWEVSEDDPERLNKLVNVVCGRLDIGNEHSDVVEEYALQRLDEEREDEEEEGGEEDLMFG